VISWGRGRGRKIAKMQAGRTFDSFQAVEFIVAEIITTDNS
jgi:hypothetical protein